MPKLDDATRKSIAARSEKRAEIRKKFEDKQYTSQHCRLCNYASNGQTLDEAILFNKEHERLHPELAKYESNLVNIPELVRSLHDHECQMALCVCKCGCKEGPFCTLIFGSLCSVCTLASNRGYEEHGLPDNQAKVG